MIGHITGESNPTLDTAGSRQHFGGPIVLGADYEQVGVRTHRGYLPEGLHEAYQVLARLQVAYRQDVLSR